MDKKQLNDLKKDMCVNFEEKDCKDCNINSSCSHWDEQPPKDASASEPTSKGSEGSDARTCITCKHWDDDEECARLTCANQDEWTPKESEPKVKPEVVGESPKG